MQLQLLKRIRRARARVCTRTCAWGHPSPADNRCAPLVPRAAASKAQMAAMWRSHLVRQFKKVHFPKGHQCTSYRLWMNATRPYLVDYQSEYEPWFISHRDWLPW